MPVYFEYFLKVSICLAIVFLFYTLLLKRITYYNWNRYFLLLFSIVSFVVPFINISVFVQSKELSGVSFISQIPSIHTYSPGAELPGQQWAFNFSGLFFLVFLVVASILLLRLLIQVLSVIKIKSRATLLVDGEVKIYHLAHPVLPFSFLNSIFINKDNYSENELTDILNHERVHVQQKHTIDVLVTEIICIINWYNPFAWLIKKAVRENLEFIADEAVLSRGIDKKSYQYLLLKVTGDIPLSVTSSLKFSTLKNRILMMNKTKTRSVHLLRFALLVPMLVVLLAAFRNRKETTVAEVKSQSEETYTLSTLTYSIPDEKVKAIVTKETANSFLKPGQLLNLTLISHEKDRLKTLLERNGYNNLKSNAIRFWIDTASVNNSFSIEVKINIEATIASVSKQSFHPFKSGTVVLNSKNLVLGEKINIHNSNAPNTFKELNNYAVSNYNKTIQLI